MSIMCEACLEIKEEQMVRNSGVGQLACFRGRRSAHGCSAIELHEADTKEISHLGRFGG